MYTISTSKGGSRKLRSYRASRANKISVSRVQILLVRTIHTGEGARWAVPEASDLVVETSLTDATCASILAGVDSDLRVATSFDVLAAVIVMTI